jgi:polysaccharide biosynthesis transport protein
MSDNGHGYWGERPEATAPAVVMPAAPLPQPSLGDYLSILWRRKWLILAVVVIATATTYFVSSRQAAVYEASADLIYERQLDMSNPLTGQNAVDSADRYVQLTSVASVISSPDMEQRAAAQLASGGVTGTDYEVTSEVVADQTGNTASTLSSVVRITSTSGDAELAAASANAYALAFVDYRKEIIKQQVQHAIDAVNAKMDTYPDGAKDSTEYLILQQRLQDLQLSRATATGNFRVLVPAVVPEAPVSPKPLRDAALAFAVSLVLAMGLALLLEQFDVRMRRAEDVSAILHQPVLGRIPRISHRTLHDGFLVSLSHPGGDVAEAFRMVRTNLEFLSVDSPVRSLIVTSCVQGEGKSLAVANLAVTLAMGGKKVVVVDADLRRPRQHEYFGLPNTSGVSTVVTGQTRIADTIMPVQVADLKAGETVAGFASWAQGTDARSRLYVLTSGPIPPNPGEIVASQRFGALIEELTEEPDIVLIDSPAMLPVGDTAAMASKVDGLLFLVNMQVIKKPQLAAAADQLVRLPVRQLGIVVRGAGTGERSYGRYGYSYSSSFRDRKRPPPEGATQIPAPLRTPR